MPYNIPPKKTSDPHTHLSSSSASWLSPLCAVVSMASLNRPSALANSTAFLQRRFFLYTYGVVVRVGRR